MAAKKAKHTVKHRRFYLKVGGVMTHIPAGTEVELTDKDAKRFGAKVAPAGATAVEVDEQVKASAAATKLAEENGIDLATITGTGKDGAISKPDVQAAIDAAAE